ncbi:MAG: hypothetical protein J6S51_03090 [Kiritimatiellae bacterium]|nr:hypothetical protein [Kiritimatiellia bacterium]
MRNSVIAIMLLLCGCASYNWKSTVPKDLSTIDIPVFRNETSLTGFGATLSTQVAREFQREGSFKLSTSAAIEIQGVAKKTTISSRDLFAARTRRHREHIVNAQVEVSVVNKLTGEVVVESRLYEARTTVLADNDIVTAERSAAGRLAEQIARQVVDDLVHFNWKKGGSK